MEDIKLIEWLTSRYNIPGYERQDVRQELILVYLKAKKGWDKNAGTPFNWYYTRAVRNRISELLHRTPINEVLVDEVPETPVMPENEGVSLSEAKHFVNSLQHPALKKALYAMIELSEAGIDPRPFGKKNRIAGFSRQYCHKLLSKARKMPEFIAFRKEFHSA